MTCLQRKLDVEEAGPKHRDMLGKKKVLPMFLVSANYRTCDISISLRSFNLLHNLHDFALLDLCFEFFSLSRAPLPVSDLKDLPIGAAF